MVKSIVHFQVTTKDEMGAIEVVDGIVNDTGWNSSKYDKYIGQSWRSVRRLLEAMGAEIEEVDE